MADIQTFPIIWEDFVKTYEFRDKEELYTNGAMLIPSFRVEQMVKHYFAEPMSRPNIVRCKDCKHFTPRGTHKFENGKVNEDYCDYVRGWMLQITPDGFCAWGERRDA